MEPLITSEVHEALLAARADGSATIECSLDLQQSVTRVEVGRETWSADGRSFPYLEVCRERTIYQWDGAAFRPLARYGRALVKLVPTPWGPPTFEIDGIKMLPTARLSPLEDAARKVELIEPRAARILDTCGGLGYFAAWCLRLGAGEVWSYEKNPDVIWLRRANPWSPRDDARLHLIEGDVAEHIGGRPAASVDAILHDPPRFGIAGELYSRAFYDQLARVLRRKGKLFHYTGSPNRLSRGRDLRGEVARRLTAAGFATERHGDGVLAIRR